MANEIDKLLGLLDERRAVLSRKEGEADTARKALAKADHERDVALEGVRTLEDAIRVLGYEVSSTPAMNDPAVAQRVAMGKGKKPPKKGTPLRMSEKWKRIIGAMVEQYPDSFSQAATIRLAKGLGYEVQRNTARAQLLAYTGGGYAERMSDGSFRATQVAADALNLKLGKKAKKNETLSAATESVSETDSEDDASLSSGDEKVTSLFDR